MNAITTLLLFPFQPRRVAVAHADTPLRRVYMIHWMGLIAFWVVAAGIDVVVFQLSGQRDRTLVEQILTQPDGALRFLAVVLCGEAAFVLVGSAMTCWAGRDEPSRETWLYAIRMSWLYVVHLLWVLPGTVGVVSVAVALDLDESWVFATSLTTAGVIIWSIASYMRALTARDAPVAPTYPNCRWCGYDISHLDTSGQCPECGHEIGASMPRQPGELDKIKDPICEWCGYSLVHLDPGGSCPECGQRVFGSTVENPRRPLTKERNVVDLCTDAWMRPEPLFRSIAVLHRSSAAVSCFVLGVVAAGFAGWCGFLAGVALFVHPPMIAMIDAVLNSMAPFVGLCGWIYFMSASALASVFGLRASRHVGRNRFTAAVNVLMLLSPVIPLWSFAAVFTLGVAFIELRSPNVVFGWLALNLAILVLFARAINRRMRFVQYANR